MRQQIAVEHHQGGMGLGPRHRIECRSHQPPVRVLTVRTERRQLRALENRLPLRRVSRSEIGHQCGVRHGIEVNIGYDQQLPRRVLARGLRGCNGNGQQYECSDEKTPKARVIPANCYQLLNVWGSHRQQLISVHRKVCFRVAFPQFRHYISVGLPELFAKSNSCKPQRTSM